MQNSIAAGRRLAFRVVCTQLGVTAAVAVGFALVGWRSALGALGGGSVIAAATAVLGIRLFTAGPSSAGAVLARLIAGNLLKWGVVAVGMYLMIVKAALPGLPVICGVAVAVLVVPLAGIEPMKVKT